MEDYPASYVARPRPLVVLSGFDSSDYITVSSELLRNGPQISSDSPIITGEHGKRLLEGFLALDSDGSKDTGQSSTAPQFRVKATGRVNKTIISGDNLN